LIIASGLRLQGKGINLPNVRGIRPMGKNSTLFAKKYLASAEPVSFISTEK
jgi:hypothetical protein